jgi:hypothetical protein
MVVVTSRCGVRYPTVCIRVNGDSDKRDNVTAVVNSVQPNPTTKFFIFVRCIKTSNKTEDTGAPAINAKAQFKLYLKFSLPVWADEISVRESVGLDRTSMNIVGVPYRVVHLNQIEHSGKF